MVLAAGRAGADRCVEALGLTPDVVFDLDIETNRPDAMSMAGVARDVAAKLRIPFVAARPVAARARAREVDIEVESPELCPRFSGTVLGGVTVGPSPQWVQRRLTLAGMRPINNVVDASNYVMLELGQPTHPYDLARLPGGGLRVRAARPGERVVTLDGVERIVGRRPVARLPDLRRRVDARGHRRHHGRRLLRDRATDTTTVLLEAAYFTPMAIARTAKRLGLRTEASVRFERGCDPEMHPACDRPLLRAAARSATWQAGPFVVDAPRYLPTPRRVEVRTARVNAILGTELTDAEIRSYLTPIGFHTEPVRDGVQEVEIPTFRPDSEREIDVIEEVARHHGYANIARTVPSSPHVGGLTRVPARAAPGARHPRRRRLQRGVRPVAARAGRPRARRARRPPRSRSPTRWSARSRCCARRCCRACSGPSPSTASRQQPDVRLFEIGHVYPRPASPEQPLPDERERLAVALTGAGGDAVGAARVWSHPRRRAPARRRAARGRERGRACTRRGPRGCSGRDGEELGVVGEVDPDVLEAHGIDGRVGWIELRPRAAARHGPARANRRDR